LNHVYYANKKKNHLMQCVQSEIFSLLIIVNFSVLLKLTLWYLNTIHNYNWFIFYIKGVSGAKPKKNFIQENKRYVTKLAKDTQTSKENVKPSNKLPCTNIQVHYQSTIYGVKPVLN